jgi:hypothetical protein
MEEPIRRNDSIAGQYSLKDIEVSPEDLLLDPNNLRVILTERDIKKYSSNEISSDRLQQQLYHTLLENRSFKVPELAEAIEANGWISEGGFYVEHIDSNKYIVLEGNRRTCAIKYILKNGVSLTPAVRESLSKIKVQVLRVFNPKHAQRVKRVIVSARNTGGVIKFGPMHTALVAYLTHMDYLEEINGCRVNFYYDQRIAKEVANCYSLSGKRVKRMMGIYRVFEQLNRSGFKAREDIFTLLDLSLGASSLNKDYFEFDNDIKLQMTEEGLSRFAKLCIDPVAEGGKPQIHEPKQFPKFVKIYERGSDTQVRRVEERSSKLDTVYKAVQLKERDLGITRKLEDIHKRLLQLKLDKFKSSAHEMQLIEDISGTSAVLLRAMGSNAQSSLKMLQVICESLRNSNSLDVQSFANKMHKDLALLLEEGDNLDRT